MTLVIVVSLVRRSKLKKNCPNCAQGDISYRKFKEVINDTNGKEHIFDILVGICDNCQEKIYPKESAMIIERFQKPND